MIGKAARTIEVGGRDWACVAGWGQPPLKSFEDHGASYVVAIASFLVVLALNRGSQR